MVLVPRGDEIGARLRHRPPCFPALPAITRRTGRPLMEYPRSFDVAFSVPQVHRVRFTRDLFSREQDVLADVLEASGERPPRVQFWLDEEEA